MGSKKTYYRGEITIFLADDDSDDVLFFEQALEEINLPHNLHVASNGQQLIQDLIGADAIPDIVFLDINMPIKKNGMETLIDVRKELPDNVPVVMLSTSASEAMIESSQILGASGYVCKPSSYPELCKILSRLLHYDWKCTDGNAFIVDAPNLTLFASK